MSLGLIGKYGSDSSSGISDSDDDDDDDSKRKVKLCDSTKAEKHLCTDPLSLGLNDSSDSDSETSSTSPVPSPVGISTSLPLPDIDSVVARNPSYSTSGLVTEPTSATREQAEEGEENSVFFNPFKKAEEERLAILKHHVQEFDKKPLVDEESEPKRGYFGGRRGYRETRGGYQETGRGNRSRGGYETRGGYRMGHGSSHTTIPPPASYARGHHLDTTHHGPHMGRNPGGKIPHLPGGPGQVTQFPGGPMGWDPNSPGGPMKGTPHHHQGGAVGGTPHHHGGPMGGDPYWEEPTTENELFGDDDSSSLVKKPRKHRSGVTDSLLPPKKFMRAHEKIQAKERPWTLGK